MAAGSIIIDLLMKTGSFETDTKRAEKRLQELKKEAMSMGVAVGAAFAGVSAASIAMVHSSLENMDTVSKMSQMYGVATETLSAMGHAAKLADVSQEELGVSLGRLSKAIVEGNDAFKTLGLSTTNAQGFLKTTDEMLVELAEKFQKMPDGPVKTAAAIELFGRSGAKLIPLLNGGATGLEDMRKEAAALGVLLDGDVAKSAEEFNDNLTRMGEAVQGVANRATTELLPTLIAVSEQLVEMAKNEDAVRTVTDIVTSTIGGLINVFQTVVVVGSNVAFVFKGIGREIGTLYAQAEALGIPFTAILQGPAATASALAGAVLRGESSVKRFNEIATAAADDAKRAREELDKFQAGIMRLGEPKYQDPRILGPVGSIASQTAGWARGRPPPKKDGAGGAGKDPDADFKAYLNNLEQQVQKTQQLTVVEKLLDDIRRGSLTLRGNQQERLMVLAKEIDTEKEAMAIAKERQAQRNKDYDEAVAGARELEAADRAWLKNLTDDTPTRKMEELLRTLEKLDKVFEAGGVDPQVYQEARNNLVGLTEETKKGTSAAEQFGAVFASSAESAIKAGANLGDIFKSLAQDLVQLIFRLTVIEPMMESLRSSVKTGGGGNIFGSLISAAAGAFGAGAGVPPPANPYLARGGPVSANTPYIVGDGGEPEWFIPRTAGMVVPMSKAAGGGGQSVHITQNMTVGDVASMAAVDARLKRARQEMLAGLDRANRYGG